MCLLSGAVDADTTGAQIMFVLSNYGNGGDVGNGCGFVSLKSRPSLAVTRFSMEDIAIGRVLFTHRGKEFRNLKVDISLLFHGVAKDPFLPRLDA